MRRSTLRPRSRTARPMRIASCSGTPSATVTTSLMPAASASCTAASVPSGGAITTEAIAPVARHGRSAVGEHRHAGGFRDVGAGRRAADDVGAVGAHQRRVGAPHPAGDALHDDGRRAGEGADHARVAPLPVGTGAIVMAGPDPDCRTIGTLASAVARGRGSAFAPAMTDASLVQSSRSSVTNMPGWRSARMRFASSAPRPTSRATTGTRRLGRVVRSPLPAASRIPPGR